MKTLIVSGAGQTRCPIELFWTAKHNGKYCTGTLDWKLIYFPVRNEMPELQSLSMWLTGLFAWWQNLCAWSAQDSNILSNFSSLLSSIRIQKEVQIHPDIFEESYRVARQSRSFCNHKTGLVFIKASTVIIRCHSTATCPPPCNSNSSPWPLTYFGLFFKNTFCFLFNWMDLFT